MLHDGFEKSRNYFITTVSSNIMSYICTMTVSFVFLPPQLVDFVNSRNSFVSLMHKQLDILLQRFFSKISLVDLLASNHAYL